MNTQRLSQKGAFEIHKLLQQAPEIIHDLEVADANPAVRTRLRELERVLMEADSWAKALSDT